MALPPVKNHNYHECLALVFTYILGVQRQFINLVHWWDFIFLEGTM